MPPNLGLIYSWHVHNKDAIQLVLLWIHLFIQWFRPLGVCIGRSV